MPDDEQPGFVLLVTALQEAWDDIRRLHPGVPVAWVVPAISQRSRGRLGHFSPLRWMPGDGAQRHEIAIVSEHLGRGAADVFGTLVHEAAHALNHARGIVDTHPNQYHTKRFKGAAEALRLTVAQVDNYGFAHTELTGPGAEQYAAIIERLDLVIGGVRRQSRGRAGSSRLRRAVCRCRTIVYMSMKVAGQGSVVCSRCGSRFVLAPLRSPR